MEVGRCQLENEEEQSCFPVRLKAGFHRPQPLSHPLSGLPFLSPSSSFQDMEAPRDLGPRMVLWPLRTHILLNPLPN